MPIVGYQLQRWNNAWEGVDGVSGDRDENGNTDTVTEDIDSDLSPGTKYFYRIRALTGDNAGSDWSTETTRGAASATTHGGAPGAVDNADNDADNDFTLSAVPGLVADGIPGGINLTWVVPADTGGSNITGYDVQIWDGANQRWVDEATTTSRSYNDRGLARGATYYYRVRAKNSLGDGPWTPYKEEMTPNAVPSAPVLTATAIGTTDSIRLTWTVPAANGQAITNYVLEKWSAGANDWAIMKWNNETCGICSDNLYS